MHALSTASEPPLIRFTACTCTAQLQREQQQVPDCARAAIGGKGASHHKYCESIPASSRSTVAEQTVENTDRRARAHQLDRTNNSAASPLARSVGALALGVDMNESAAATTLTATLEEGGTGRIPLALAWRWADGHRCHRAGASPEEQPGSVVGGSWCCDCRASASMSTRQLVVPHNAELAISKRWSACERIVTAPSRKDGPVL